MTLVTDYLLGALCVVFAMRLRRGRPDASRLRWSAALLACSAAAFFGGTYHGFLPRMGETTAGALWTVTLLAIGVAAFFGTVATARSRLPSGWQRRVEIAAAIQLALYALAVTRTSAFVLAIADYSVAFGFVLVVHARAWKRTRDTAALWIVLGVLVSFLAAGIQAAGLAPHRHFNHNDLYHVVQMAGMWMLYRGAAGSAQRRD